MGPEERVVVVGKVLGLGIDVEAEPRGEGLESHGLGQVVEDGEGPEQLVAEQG